MITSIDFRISHGASRWIPLPNPSVIGFLDPRHLSPRLRPHATPSFLSCLSHGVSPSTCPAATRSIPPSLLLILKTMIPPACQYHRLLLTALSPSFRKTSYHPLLLTILFSRYRLQLPFIPFDCSYPSLYCALGRARLSHQTCTLGRTFLLC